MTRCPWCGAPHDVLPSCGPGKPGRCAWCGAGQRAERLEQVRWLVGANCISAECARDMLDIPDLGTIIEYEGRPPEIHQAIVRKYESFAEPGR